jgi:hypothetical protein
MVITSREPVRHCRSRAPTDVAEASGHLNRMLRQAWMWLASTDSWWVPRSQRFTREAMWCSSREHHVGLHSRPSQIAGRRVLPVTGNSAAGS